MDGTDVMSSGKRLQRYLKCLSKHMTRFGVERMASWLCETRSITSYEAQVVTSHATDMEKASTLIQMVLKGRNACSSFLICLGICEPKMYKTVTGYQVRVTEMDHHSRDILQAHPIFSETQCPYNNPTYIINIHNSSLKNCIFGNNNKQCVTYGQHALLSQNDAMNVDEVDVSQSHDQLIPAQDPVSGNGIQIDSSHIEYVIIGDLNNMTLTDYLNSETEKDTEVEPDVNG